MKSREAIEKAISFDLDKAIKNFNRNYPEFEAIPVDTNYDNKYAIVFVGDGYHAIDERVVSHFIKSIDDARHFR